MIMLRLYKVSKNYFLFLLNILLLPALVWGQSNPVVHDLSTSNYTFTGFGSGATTAYPTSMQGHKFPAERTSANINENADGDRALVVSTDGITTGSVRNEVANGISLLNSGTNNIGAIVVAVNTTSRTNLLVTFTAQQLNDASTRVNGLRLQYRIGTTGSFTDVSPTTEYLTTLSGTNSATTFTNISLPVVCEDQPIVHIRWVYYMSSGSGSRDRIRLDDIIIASDAIATPGTSTIAAGPTAEPVSFSSLLNSQGTAVLNFDFTLLDDGSTPSNDDVATQLSQLRFRQGTGNDIADWTTAILGAELSDGTNTQTGTINATNITFSSIANGSGQLGHIPDNGNKNYSLKIWLKTDLGSLKTTIDGLNFVFRIINSDFTITGSQLLASQDVNSGATNNAVAAVSTALTFEQNTSNVNVNDNMSPSPAVSANDANGNRDLNFNGTVSITSTGTLNSTPQTVSATSGLATFTINHTASATSRTLTASASGFSNIVSTAFNITSVTNATATLWSGGTSAWLTVGNWGSGLPTSTTVAQFGNAAQTTVGINMNTATLANRTIGAIEFVSGAVARTINNSSGTVANNFILTGVAINNVSNTVLRNNSSNTMTIADGTQTLGLNFSNTTNNNVSIESSGSIVVSCIISGANPITKIGSGSGVFQLTGANTYTGLTTVSAGTLQLNKSGGTTIPITNNITVNGGTLKVSSNQTLNNIVLTSGTIVVDASTTLTINGTLTLNGGTITNNGTIAYGPTGTLVYNTGTSQTISSEWPSTNGPANITVQGASSNVTLAANRTINNALILTNGVLSIGPNTLTLNGTVSGSGTITGSATSNLTIGGTVGTINFTSGSRTIQHLIIGTGSNASLTLGTALDIAPTGGITFNAGGTKSLTTAGKTLTLKSIATNTAYIGNINGATITGNITVERFISNSGRRWRFFASPHSNATFEDLQQEIYITGAGIGSTSGTLNSNGFDATLSNQPSVYSYTESTTGNLNSGWNALTNSTSSLSNQPIVAGKGYRIFVRGDRTDITRLTGSNLTSNTVTVNTTGTINTGDMAMPVTYTSSNGQANDGWNLVGNPYPCAYDWNAFRDNNVGVTNIDSTIYILDATSGSYKSYNSNSGGSLTGGIIPSGASFWVKANGTSPALTLTEQFKVTSTPIALFKNNSTDELSLELRRDSITSDVFILAHYPASVATKDAYDITKLNGEINLMSVGNDGISLAYDARPVISLNDTVNLFVTGGNYTYTISAKSLPVSSGKLYYLIDKKLANAVLLTHNFSYNYNTSIADSTSFGNRFQLVISSSNALPVIYQNFIATKHQKSILLNWSTASEINSHYFEAEKSTDCATWETIANVIASGNSNSLKHYQTTDERPSMQTVNYYRIKQVDFDNEISYSPIQVVSFDNDQTITTDLVPNPATNRVDIITTATFQKAIIKDVNGKLISETTESFFDLTSFKPGMYIVKIVDTNGNVHNQKLIKN